MSEYHATHTVDNTTPAASAASCVTRPTTCSGWLAALSECMTVEFRTDGTPYSTLSDSSEWDEIREDLRGIVREAHFNEMPNDWRFDTVDSIAAALTEMADCELWTVEDFQQESHQVADSLVDVYTNALLTWVSEDIRRHQWDDDSIVEPTTDIMELIKLRQYEEIESMVGAVLNEIEKLIDG